MRVIDCLRTHPLKEKNWIAFFVLALVVFAAYANVYRNDFLYDDFYLIRDNEFLKSWIHLPDLLTRLNFAGSGRTDGFYRPVPALTHFFVYQAFGPSTIAFHTLNIALHIFNACLVYILGLRLNFKKGAVFAGALLWSLHPLHTEAVTFMAATPELLWGTFCLLGLVVLLPDFKPRQIWMAASFFLLALGCKETSMIFPALATLCLFHVSQERARFGTYIRTWPLWAMTFVYLVVLVTHMRTAGTSMIPWDAPTDFDYYIDSMPVRLFTSLATLPVYLKLIFWPSGLHMDYSFPIFASLLSGYVLMGAAITGAGILQILCSRIPPLTFGILWFAIAFSPSSGVLVPVNALVSEHWMYFPTMGLFLGLTATVEYFLKQKKNIAITFVALAALLLSVKTHFQNRVWENAVTLNENTLTHGGRAARAHSSLIDAYIAVGDFDKAIEHYEITKALPQDPDPSRRTSIHLHVAFAYLHVRGNGGHISLADVSRALQQSPQHIPEAIVELEKAIEINPEQIWPHAFLLIIYEHLGDIEKTAFYKKHVDDLLQKRELPY